MAAYYNENDPFAAAWLRELIKAGHIASGEVDERSIEDVRPSDLIEFTQCHFFAGIGVWSHALRLSGWADDRQVWTGSCPCQPFSSAGQRKGLSDERHLWPVWFRLIEARRPKAIFGEQVLAAVGKIARKSTEENKPSWFDIVQADLENINYTVGSHGLAACSVGAPHQRKRIYFVADNQSERCGETGTSSERPSQRLSVRSESSGSLAHTECGATERRRQHLERSSENSKEKTRKRERIWNDIRSSGLFISVEHSNEPGFSGRVIGGNVSDQRIIGQTGVVNGFWEEVEWISCQDGKYRATQPGLFPLAHGITNRVGKLRGYGNAIVAPQAQAFIEAYMEIA